MKKIASFITKKKVWVIAFFVLACLLSAIFVGKVKINYDISKYLSSDSETSIALKIVEDEFGSTGNMQVMVSNVSKDTSKEIEKDLEKVEYVLTVNYDSESENSYKDGNALYVLLIDGDDYSEHAKSVSENVKELLKDYDTSYGGTAIDKQRLQKAIESEMVYIIIAAVSLAFGVLLLTSNSWLEPVLLFLVAGVAILINQGTNVFFPSISYITRSISACLQLALSIDYSIVLLHTYRKNKDTLPKEEAMKKAIIEVIKPVSASGLTTLAGLCALLFMSYRIGFDIGIVLMKGILISLVTSLTLLPGVVLLCDNLLAKTHKKSIRFSGKFFANLAKKANKVIVPVGLVLICGCGVLNFSNTYTYSNQSNVDRNIAENFGSNNQFMVVFPKETGSYENQEAFLKKIEEYKDKDGKNRYVSSQAYTNTVLEEYDEKKIAKNLEVSDDDAKMMLTMYHLMDDTEALKITFKEMVDYADCFLNNDPDAKDYVDDSSKDTIRKVVAVNNLLQSENTSGELYTLLTSSPLSDMGSQVDEFSLQELYGLYYYDTLEEDKVSFDKMLSYICYVGENVDAFRNVMDKDTLASLKMVSSSIDEKIKSAMTPFDKTTFRGYMYKTYQKVISEEEASMLYKAYFQSKGMKEEETIPYLNLMEFLVNSGNISDEEAVFSIKKARAEYDLVTAKYGYDSFLPVLKQVIYGSTGSMPEISISDDEVKMIYVSYFDEQKAFDGMKIKGSQFVSYVKNAYETDETMKRLMGEETYHKISDLNTIDISLSKEDVYDYQDMCSYLDVLKASLNTSLEDGDIKEDMLLGLYVKYEVNHEDRLLAPIPAKDLLDFVDENKESNSLLKKKLDEEKLSKIDEAKGKLETAKKLFEGDNHYRLLVSMDLDTEGEDTEAFVSYLKEEATSYFGENAYIAGESVSTLDLKNSFATDQILISVVTIVSILIIVAFTFKSASLPVILVLVIQGACFIAFSINFFTGPVFFMSYIIASCILMGATVDYGILMSSNYLENRKTMEKRDALEAAIKASLPTIFSSGLILTICGFVIYFVSSQTTIASVGLLVGEGTVAAIFLILFLLPSLLYMLDKLIMKTTMKRKKKEEQKAE